MNENSVNNEIEKFIQANIINKNYSRESFETFLLKLDKSKNSIYEWTISNIIPYLQEFYSKVPTNVIISIPSSILEKNVMNNGPIISKLQNPKIFDKGLIEAGYVLYEISTTLTTDPSINYLVCRRYSDFIWLRECLCNLFPGEFIPKLPKKKIGNRRFEDDFIAKRMNHLQKFMDIIIQKENFKASPPLFQFLTLSDRVLFEYQKKLISPQKYEVKQVNQLLTLNGKVDILDFDNENYTHCTNRFKSILNFIRLNRNCVNDLKNEFKNCINNLINSILSLEKINKIFEALIKLNTKDSLPPQIPKIYEQYRIFFRNYNKIMRNQITAIEDEFLTYCKNVINEGDVYVELFEKQEELINEFQTMKINLLTKKETLWKTMDVSKWEIGELPNNGIIDNVKLIKDKNYALSKMCTKDNIELNEVYLKLGYSFNKNNENFYFFKNKVNNELKLSIQNFSNKFSSTVNDLLDSWSNMQSNIE